MTSSISSINWKLLRRDSNLFKNLCLTFTIAMLFLIPDFGSANESRRQQLLQQEASQTYVQNLSYGINTDLADEKRQRLFNHSLGYGGSFRLFTKYRASVSLRAFYQSLDNQIIEDYRGSVQLADANFTLATNNLAIFQSKQGALSANASFNITLPLSERSRREGYLSVPSLSSGVVYQMGKFTFLGQLRGNSTINTYETSTLGTSNPAFGYAGALGAGLSVWKFYAQYSYRIGITQSLDSTQTGGSGNSLLVSYSPHPGINIAISTQNVNYPEDYFVDFWFYNTYSRFYNLIINWAF